MMDDFSIAYKYECIEQIKVTNINQKRVENETRIHNKTKIEIDIE